MVERSWSILAGSGRQASACRHKRLLTMWRTRGPGAPKAPPAGRAALDGVAATSSIRPMSDTSADLDRGDDGCSRALRRRVTLIYGGYHSCPWQSTHDSAASGGRAVCRRELEPKFVSHGCYADPHNRASDHPPSSRSSSARVNSVVGHAPPLSAAVSSLPPEALGALPTGIPPAHARWPQRSPGAVCSSPRVIGSADTNVVAPYPRWQ
jgi:hypothetical protein